MHQSDQQSPDPAAAGTDSGTPALTGRRMRRLALAIALGGGLALGTGGIAYAVDDPSPAPGHRGDIVEILDRRAVAGIEGIDEPPLPHTC